jgi:serine/threonine protein kinase
MSFLSADDELLDAMDQEFLACYRRGERPDIEEYAARHPHLAGRIRNRLTAALNLEQARLTGSGGGTSKPPAGVPTIAGYEVHREVGRGGMGVVYEAEDLTLWRRVALKVLPRTTLLVPRQVERFRHEVRVAATLQYENIVPVYGAGEADGQHYYTMLFVRGAALDRVIRDLPREGEPAPADVCAAHPSLTGTSPSTGTGLEFFRSVARIGIQVAEALQYAHDRGVWHRDIKPANLILDERGTVWVTDFGLAKTSDSDAQLTETGTPPPGTLAYSSPERFDGQLTARSDIYSLGLTLYELLAHRRAYDEERDVNRLLEQVVMAEPPRLRTLKPQVPRDLETIVHKAMAREPDDRYQAARDLAEDLQRFLDDRPIRARPFSALGHSWRWCRRNPVMASLLALLFVAAVGLLLFWEHANRQATSLLLAENDKRERENQRLEEEKQRTLELAHAREVRTAEAHAGRGNWPEAIRAYTRAIEDGLDDRLDLEVDRLRGFFAINEWTILWQELERLQSQPLGRHRATVLLMRGDFLFCNQDRQVEAEKAVREALALGGLAPEDAAYSEGLLAEKPLDKLRNLRKAIDLAPSRLHHRASGALCMALTCLGYLAEARQEAKFMQRIYTEDPLPLFVDALIDLLEGERESSLRKLDSLRKKLAPDKVELLRDLLAEVGKALSILEKMNGTIDGLVPQDFFGLAGIAARIGALARKATEPLGFGIPTVSVLFQRLSAAARSFGQSLVGQHEKALQTVTRAMGDCPDTLLLLLATTYQGMLWQQVATRGDRTAARAALVAVAERWRQAQVAPALLPRMAFRYQALLLATGAEATLIQDHEAADPARRERLTGNLHRLVIEGQRFPQMRRTVCERLVPELAPSPGRVLLETWQLLQPEDEIVLRLRAQLELKAKNYTAVLTIADRMLKRKPKDREWDKLRADAVAGIRALASQLH